VSVFNTLIIRPIWQIVLKDMFNLKLKKMEEVTTAQKVITDKSEKAQRIIAQASAKKDKPVLRNINTGRIIEGFDVEKNAVGVKQHDKPKPKAGANVVAPPKPKKEAKPKLSEKIDELIAKSGKWEDLVADANKFCKDNGLKSVVTVGSFKTQLHWRRVVQKQADYMCDRKFTDKGIEKIAKPKK